MRFCTILMLIVSGPVYSQSLAVTSPANGSVVTTGFRLTAVPIGLPSLAQMRFYIDNRQDCVVNDKYLGGWSCPGMTQPTYSDERAATIYAEAYNAIGTLIATSATNTFRINNGGLNAAATFNFSGIVTAGATISGTGTVVSGSNSSTVLTPSENWDGGEIQPTMYALNSSYNSANGHFTVPVIWGHTGMPVNTSCQTAAATGCAGGNADLPSAFSFGPQYYLNVVAANSICVSTSSTGSPCVTGGTQGVTTEYTAFVPSTSAEYVLSGNPSQFGSTVTYDTTHFRDGRHTFSLSLSSSPQTIASTFTFAASAITLATGHVHAVNFPLTQGNSFTVSCSGSCPAEWTGTMFAAVLGPDDWCPASSAANATAGTCISISGIGSGTDTISFTASNPFWAIPGSGSLEIWGVENTPFTFSNGAVPMALRTKYSKCVGTAGGTCTLAPYILNCDGSTTAISASLPIYSTSDSTRATVSTAGVITRGSTPGFALVSLVDNTHLRETIVEVEVRADATTFKQFTTGFGIINSFDAAKSVPGIVPFNAIIDLVTHNPFPLKYIEGAGFKAMYGPSGIGATIDPLSQPGAYSTFNGWNTATWGSGSGVYSKAYWTTTVPPTIGHLQYYGSWSSNCAGYQAWAMQRDAWRQQALSQMLNDVAPLSLGNMFCDEMTTPWSNLMRFRGDMGSGQDSLGGTTLGGVTAGLSSIVVASGGLATANFRTWPLFGDTFIIQITGATTHNLNGPYTISGTVYGNDDPRGQYIVSFQFQTVGVTAGTYNSGTDAGLTIIYNQEGEGGLVSTNNGPVGWGGSGPSSIACASNLCTGHWTAASLTDMQACQLANFSTSGLNGLYRCDLVDANTFTFTSAGVANGTYSVSTDASGTINPIALFPQAFVPNWFSTWLTGSHAPLGANLLGGGNAKWIAQSWFGTNSLTNYQEANITIGQGNRYGAGGMSYRDFFRTRWTVPLIDGSLPANLQTVDKPVMYGTPEPGDTCFQKAATVDCKVDVPGGALIELGKRQSGGTVLTGNLVPWLLPNAAGSKEYQLIGGIVAQKVPPTPPLASYQSAPDWIDNYTDQYLGVANANHPIVREAKYILQPPLSSPDRTTGPSPYPMVECASHSGSPGSSMLCVNLGAEDYAEIFDLSLINSGGTCSFLRRWNLNQFGDTVTQLTASAQTDSITLLQNTGVLYICQATGTPNDLTTQTVAVTPGAFSGGTNSVVEVSYFPTLPWNFGDWQKFDCGTSATCSVPVMLAKLPVYWRVRTTKADGSTAYVTPEFQWAAQ